MSDQDRIARIRIHPESSLMGQGQITEVARYMYTATNQRCPWHKARPQVQDWWRGMARAARDGFLASE